MPGPSGLGATGPSVLNFTHPQSGPSRSDSLAISLSYLDHNAI
ncbi:hypothetical protein CEV34_3858 [Brucella pseudogrignonensis]|uniref:Uncharacterized protein n=1 Tax=Brucella pseudogrignonensis TaxID=419475 RepID=A0A256G7N2_9HYPH|nr:hypothetical protein CEV34_3858 [Brucella pseudogrignonensis]